MIRKLALAILFAAVAPAAASAAPLATPPAPAATPVTAPAATSGHIATLKAAASVSSDLVRIGDLIDNAGADADTPIFRAPDVGTAGAVTVDQVLDAVRPYHIYLVDTGGRTEIEVSHIGRTIGATEIEASIARTFAGRYGLGEARNLTVTLDLPARPLSVEASAIGDLVPTALLFDPRSGRFDISLGLPGGSARRAWRFTGTVVETIAAVVATRALARGEIVRAADVTTERRPKSEAGAEAVVAENEAVGLAVRQPVRSGQALRRLDLMRPELVHRDDNVTLVYAVPGILLTTQGKAVDAGSEGDMINVVNVQTKRTIQGVVTGANRVTVMVSTARISSEASNSAIANSVASR